MKRLFLSFCFFAFFVFPYSSEVLGNSSDVEYTHTLLVQDISDEENQEDENNNDESPADQDSNEEQDDDVRLPIDSIRLVTAKDVFINAPLLTVHTTGIREITIPPPRFISE
jgi:hypothetical protein